MKQRMKLFNARLRSALGNSNGSIMLITLVLMMSVTVVAVGLNTSVMTTATDTYDQYYESQTYYTARSVATAIAQEIEAQSADEFTTVSAATDIAAVVASEPLLAAMATLRDGATQVTLEGISFTDAEFIEGEGDYITATITRDEQGTATDFGDDTYIVTVDCEINGIADSVSVELTTTEETVTIGSDESSSSSTSTATGSVPGFYAESFSFSGKMKTDEAKGVLIASSNDITLTVSGDSDYGGAYFMSQGNITITTAGKTFKMVKYDNTASELYALGNVTLNASNGEILLDGGSGITAGGTVTLNATNAKITIDGDIVCYNLIVTGSKEVKINGTVSVVNKASSTTSYVDREIDSVTVSVATRSVPEWLDSANYYKVTSGSTVTTSSKSSYTYFYVEAGGTLTINSDTDEDPLHIYGETGSTVTCSKDKFYGTITAGTINITNSDFTYYYVKPGNYDLLTSDEYTSTSTSTDSSSSTTTTTTEEANYYTYTVSQYLKG